MAAFMENPRKYGSVKTSSVKLDNVASQPLRPSAGFRQGCILSPLLFNIYTKAIMRIALDDWTDGVSIGGKNICNLRDADDNTLLACNHLAIRSLLQAKELLNRVETVALVSESTGTKPK